MEIAYSSTRYTLGTKLVPRGWEPPADCIQIPVYAYIHSGVAMSHKPFSCPWDSGQCGIAYMTKSEAGKYRNPVARLEDFIEEVYDAIYADC